MVGHQALVILLAVIWGLASTVEQGTTAASEVAQLFHRRAYTSDMVYTVQTPVSALSKCAGHCTLSPTCRGLCYSTSTSRCYLNDKSASPAQSVVGDSGDMRCFAHGTFVGLFGSCLLFACLFVFCLFFVFVFVFVFFRSPALGEIFVYVTVF